MNTIKKLHSFLLQKKRVKSFSAPFSLAYSPRPSEQFSELREGKKNRIINNLMPALAMLCLVCAYLLNPVQANAMASEKERVAAVISIVNTMLLSEGSGEKTELELELNSLTTGTFTVRDGGFTTTFERQNYDLELCFQLSSSRVALSINGVLQEGANRVVGGENCYTIPVSQQQSENVIVFQTNEGGVVRLSTVSVEPKEQAQLGLASLTRSSWDERAVRKVLKIFAFGGHAFDRQIELWADMPPKLAIAEMLNFSEHNLKLSPLAEGERYTQTATAYGKLGDFATFLSDPSSDIPIPEQSRSQYAINNYNFDDSFVRLVTTRGLNPFRQRIGFWETNYHLAVNLDTNVSREQMAVYYDDIMEAHEAGLPYQEVIGVATKSAAVAMQYGHRNNRWVFDREEDKFVLNGNLDFAREVHQLFYGILGANDPNHEDGTIVETGKMLTDMNVPYIQDQGFQTFVTFETDQHHINPLTILGATITGANASEKIDNLMRVSINHPESLENLPTMIIGVLADDNLTPEKITQLNDAWASMGRFNKNLLTFIRAYAISDMFHSPDHRKFFTSHERSLFLANKFNLDNLESFFGGNYYSSGRAGRQVDNIIDDDAAGAIFRPLKNVFGGQSSQESADSALGFENNYNFGTQFEYQVRDTAQCDDCDQGLAWWKKWPSVLPRSGDGKFYVKDAAPWLWKHVTGSLDNYTELERAHLYTLLGAYRVDIGSDGEIRNNHQNITFDLPLLVCIAKDYQVRQGADADISLYNLTSQYDAWGRSCTLDDDGGEYSQTEKDLLNKAYTAQEIANDPLIQSLLDQMGDRTFDFDINDSVRENSLERINSALGFIFTTPFVFAEGQ